MVEKLEMHKWFKPLAGNILHLRAPQNSRLHEQPQDPTASNC